jgi:hypothetical protein
MRSRRGARGRRGTYSCSARHEQQSTSSQYADSSEDEEMAVRSDLLSDDSKEEHDPEGDDHKEVDSMPRVAKILHTKGGRESAHERRSRRRGKRETNRSIE